MLSYDEGYHTNDKVLANALWIGVLNQADTVDLERLFHLVDYVHRNMHHLETLPNKQILGGFASFLPLYSDKPDITKDHRVLQRLQLINEE